MRKIAFVTGATAGIGEAVALKLASEGYDLIVTGRREMLLAKLSGYIKDKYQCRVLTLNFDVRESIQVEQCITNLPQEWKDIDLLVNNAGLAVGLESIHQGIIDDWERMIDTNIKGLLYVTKYVSASMVARGRGHIINIGSIAGKDVYPNGNVYCATKHAVDALSRGMMMDLHKYNIKVSQVCPGAVETEFSLVRFKGEADKASNVYKGFKPLTAKDIAEVVYFVASAPDYVNISDVVVMPAAQAGCSIINREL